MPQAVQFPLPIHLGFSAQRKAVQSLVAAQVAKYRFLCCKSARDHLSARFRINFHIHPAGVIFLPVPCACASTELKGPGMDYSRHFGGDGN